METTKQENTITTLLRSTELSCPSCISQIESVLNRMEGVEKATVHFASGRIEIDHDSERVSPEELADVVRKAGYETSVSPY